MATPTGSETPLPPPPRRRASAEREEPQIRPSMRPPVSSYASTIDNQAIGRAIGNFTRHENSTRRTPYSDTAVNSIGLEPGAFHMRPRCLTHYLAYPALPARVGLARSGHADLVPHSSRERSGDVKKTKGTAGASNPQVGRPDSGIVAGSEISPENTLKVETPFNPVGTPGTTQFGSLVPPEKEPSRRGGYGTSHVTTSSQNLTRYVDEILAPSTVTFNTAGRRWP